MSGDIIDNLELVFCPEENSLILLNKCIKCPYCKGGVKFLPGGNQQVMNFCKSPIIAGEMEKQIQDLKSQLEYFMSNGRPIDILYVKK